MIKFTISAYKFFKNNRIVFFTILISTFLIFAFLSSKITFEEDISTLLPSTKDGGAEKVVFSNLKVKDKIFIQISKKNNDVDEDKLIEICDTFINSLLKKDKSHNAINSILYNVDEDIFNNAIQFLYENVPVFLDTSQYIQLDNLLEKEAIEKQMEENYSTLISPAGMAFKDIIVRDPVALRNLFLSNMETMGNGLGGNYTFYNNHIFTSDSSVILAFLSPNFKSFDSKQGTDLIKMIENEIMVFEEQNPDIEILYHGSPVQSAYNSKRIKQDLLITISISLFIILIILLICFKNKSNILHLLLPVIYGVLFSLAIIYLIKGSISLMAMGIGAIVMGVAFSYCLHVITHFKYVNNPITVLKDQTIPVILGTLTTIGAFLGLMLTNSELLRDFGLFASLGLVGTTTFCLLFLPQFFNTKKNKKSDKAFSILEKINLFPFEKQKWLIILICAISIICFFTSKNVKFDSNLQNIGYHEDKVVRSQKLLSSKTNSNLSTVYFAAASEDMDSALISSKRLCNKLDKLIEDNEIKGYSAPSSLFITKEEQEKRINSWRNFWTESKKEEVLRNINEASSKYKFNANTFTPFFDMLNADYEPVSLYDADIIPDEILSNVIEYTDAKYIVFTPVQMDKKSLVEVGNKVVAEDSNLIIIDPMYYTSDMVKVIHDDFNITLTISSIFVIIILLISYRSLILAIMAFLPMGLSWYIVLGSMAVFGIEFNLINIVISTFIFGVGVDYSIFIMDGLLSKYRRGGKLLTYHKTAIFLSAIVLIIVVTSLLFAVHPAIASIGTSTLIGMISTILIAYTLVPYLFSLMVTNRTKKGKAPISITNLFYIGQKQKNTTLELKNNYLYKGNKISALLKKEIKETNNYKLLNDLTNNNSKFLLDYGCGYGFCSYAIAITNNGLNITGFDKNKDDIALANNCYGKTTNMKFTTDLSVLNMSYDVLIINKWENIKNADLMDNLFENATTVVIRKELQNNKIYQSLLDKYNFVKKGSDKIFIAYSKTI